jgi:hypothetical protein
MVNQLYHLNMPLQALDSGLWVIDHALRVGGLALGARTTVVRLGDGSVALHSPGPLTDADADAVAALGPVRALIAPNLIHHLFLVAAQRRFSDARLYALPALLDKQPALRIDAPLDAWPHASALAPIAVGGMPRLQETAFVHRPTRTLLVGDLVFNIRAPAPWFTRAVMRWNGGFDRFGPTRIARSLVRDRAAARADIRRLLDEDFDRVVVCHGAILPSDGKQAMGDGFAWLLHDGA